MARRSAHFASRQRPETLRLERGIVFREALLCVAIRRRVLVNVALVDDMVERLFEPTVIYQTESGLFLRGIAIGDAGKPSMETLAVGKITKVTLTDQPFVINPTVNRSDATYGKRIVCMAAVVSQEDAGSTHSC